MMRFRCQEVQSVESPHRHLLDIRITLQWQRYQRGIAIVLIMLVASPSVFAVEFKNPDGYVAMQLEVEGTNKVVADGILKLKLKTKREKKIRASTDIEMNYNDRDAFIEELQIDYKANRNSRWTFGICKKIIGLEYERGKKNRLTIHRGPIYQKMEELGIVGRQYSLIYDLKIKKGLYLSSSIGGDNGKNFNGMMSIQWKKKNWGLASWYLGEAHHINEEQIPVFVQSYAFWFRPEQGAITLELFHGIDAARTEYEKDFGTKRSVQFSGGKLEVSSNHRLGGLFMLRPFFQMSLVVDDFKTLDANTLQFLMGTNISRGPVRIALNVETIGVKLASNLNERKFNRTNGYVEFAYFF